MARPPVGQATCGQAPCWGSCSWLGPSIGATICGTSPAVMTVRGQVACRGSTSGGDTYGHNSHEQVIYR
ncbi:hypothetical protein B296_00002914 [Ensete ventricosum]|uniref:Uncharacterized protein n=1 Tax=Ensete ventricosum TaxID=4639 RepID=A0A426YPX4_ENSVE|nr:hypothetical protein B296_00002914 [Ensete ventricosum]